MKHGPDHGRRRRLHVAHRSHEEDSRLRLTLDVLAGRVVLWLAGAWVRGTPREDAHLYLANRYVRLARIYTAQGWPAKAADCRVKAEAHLRASGPPDPPRVAVAMGRPEPLEWTDARGQPSDDRNGAGLKPKSLALPLAFTGRVRSVACAVRGVGDMLRTQKNARIHAVATVLVVAAGARASGSRLEWCAVVIAMAAVWTAEALNTAVELLVDLASPAHHPVAGRAKDVAAGAVLLAAAGAVVIALVILASRLAA